MSGKFSRNKGRREEQQLVLCLYKLGYEAERVLRQYQESGQPDVRAVKQGKITTFEMKSRRCSFKTIYDLYYQERGLDTVLCFVIDSTSPCVAISTDLEALYDSNRHFTNLSVFPPIDKKKLKVYTRIVGLNALRQKADYLVIKDNNRPRLFLRFWG